MQDGVQGGGGEIEAKIDAAALPIRELEQGLRYETSNDRELDRSFKRLEMLQKIRKSVV